MDDMPLNHYLSKKAVTAENIKIPKVAVRDAVRRVQGAQQDNETVNFGD